MADRDHTLKLRRVSAHLNKLDELIRGWTDGHHHSVRFEREAEARYVSMFIKGEQPPPDPFSLVVGDCLHNLRSSPDLLAFELAQAFTPSPLPPDIAEDSEFLIVGDVDRKGRSGVGATLFRGKLWKIRGMDPLAQAEIERLQPYHHGANYLAHPLQVLHDLDRINKHRLLHVTLFVPAGLQFVPDMLQRILNPPAADIEAYGEVMLLEVHKGVISEQETKIGRLPIPTDVSEDEMKMKIHPALRVVLEGDAAQDEPENATARLASLYNFVLSEVLPRLEPFLK